MFCKTVSNQTRKHKFDKISKLLILILFQNGAELVCKSIFKNSGVNFVKKYFFQNSGFFQTKIIQTKIKNI